jgi:hypothetical protein
VAARGVRRRLWLRTSTLVSHAPSVRLLPLLKRLLDDNLRRYRAFHEGARAAGWRHGDAINELHAPLSDAISEEIETRGVSSGHSSAPPRTQHHAGREYAPSLRESFICLSPPGPVTIPRYAPLPVRGSVHLSRQFLEKLTDSAIIKVALREDLSGEVATGSRRLAASPRGR